MGAPFYATQVGYVNLYSGATFGLIRTIYGEFQLGQFGATVAQAGDVTGDGVGEFAVAAPHKDKGYVYLFDGASGARLWRQEGIEDSARFGQSLAGIGDADGNGFPDLVAGAPYQNGSTDPAVGAIHILSGRDGTILSSHLGDQPDGHLGWAVAAAGDLDADGRIDLLAGQPQGSPTGRPGAGRVHALSAGDGTELFVCEGQSAGDAFGTALGSGGDINGDGVAEFICGAQDSAGGGLAGSGSAFLHSGRRLALDADAYTISAALGGHVTLSLDATAAEAFRGYFILASMSGVSPGIDLGGVHLDLQFDALSLLAIRLVNTPPFAGFSGWLDGNGGATAVFDTLGPVDPALAGTQIWFAAVLLAPVDWTSNTVPVEIMP